MTIEGRMQELIEDFVTKVTGLAREVALATIHAQMSRGHTAPSSKRSGNGSSPSLEEALVRHIESNPGQRVEQINKALRTTTKDVRLPLVKLVNTGAVKTKGARRGTQYFPA